MDCLQAFFPHSVTISSLQTVWTPLLVVPPTPQSRLMVPFPTPPEELRASASRGGVEFLPNGLSDDSSFGLPSVAPAYQELVPNTPGARLRGLLV